MRHKIKKHHILILFTLLWTCLIFSFSLQPADLSSNTSIGFARKILGIFAPWLLDYMESLSPEEYAVFHHFVRKAAHFTEYFVLGMLSSLTACEMKWKRIFLSAFVFCVAIASVDETIQLFVDGRAGRVVDVLLDSAGAAAGMFVLCCLMKMIRKISCMKRK